MASNQTQCEMCCKEHAVGYCKTCGDIGETCVEIHKTGRTFKIHIVNMYGEDGSNSRSIICDIRQEMCKHHPTEKTLIFCKTHNSLICGRCLQSDHLSYGEDDLELCKDATHLDCEPANDTSAALYIIREITRDITCIKEKVDQRKETNDTNMIKGNNELESLEIKLKRNVEDSKRGFSPETCTTNDKNLDANSMGSASPEMQMTRNELIEAFIQAKVDAEKAEMTIKELCNELKQVKHDVETSEKTGKELCGELKQVKHDLETSEKTWKQQCDELKQELDTSEKARKGLEKESLQAKQSLEKTEKTRKELCDELKHVKHDLETSEKTRNTYNKELLQSKNFIEQCEKTRQELGNELKLVKQDLDDSEKRKKTFEKELLQAKVAIEQSEKTRQKLCDELVRVKKDLENSEKTRKQQCDELKQELYTSEKKRNTFDKDLLQAKLVLEQYEKTMQKQCDELEQQKQDLDHSEKTRNELIEAFIKAKLDTEKAEVTQKQLRDELKGVKQDLYHSEKTRKQFEQKLLKAKQDIENSEKTQKELRDELKRVKQYLYHSEKERAVVTAQLSSMKDNIKWTQPTGTVDVKISQEVFGAIDLIFTFPDGIQTTHHPFPGKPYKGGTFTGRLFSNSEGQLLCRMLKAAFRRGVMFILGKEGKVVLDGVSLYDGLVGYLGGFGNYDTYILTLKAELAAKGITEAIIDQTEKLEETFTVDGLSLLEATRSS